MYCKDCNYFKIIQEPLPDHYDAGIAVCKKYNLETPFYHKGKFKRLECIDEDDKVKYERVKTYTSYRRLKPSPEEGDQIVITLRYCSHNKADIDRIERQYSKGLKDGTVIEIKEVDDA